MDTMDVDMTPQDKRRQIKRATKKVIQKFGGKTCHLAQDEYQAPGTQTEPTIAIQASHSYSLLTTTKDWLYATDLTAGTGGYCCTQGWGHLAWERREIRWPFEATTPNTNISTVPKDYVNHQTLLVPKLLQTTSLYGMLHCRITEFNLVKKRTFEIYQPNAPATTAEKYGLLFLGQLRCSNLRKDQVDGWLHATTSMMVSTFAFCCYLLAQSYIIFLIITTATFDLINLYKMEMRIMLLCLAQLQNCTRFALCANEIQSMIVIVFYYHRFFFVKLLN